MNEEGFIYWKVGPHGEKISFSNALIDDLRIMKTLYAASEAFSDPTYREIAKRIQDFILHRQLNLGYLVSFYEQQYNQPASEITLSYIDVEALDYFPRHVAERLEELLLKHQGSIFYPQRFQITTGEFEWNEELHLFEDIDQDFSSNLYKRLTQLKNENGGYTVGENAHFFDNILPLLAETLIKKTKVDKVFLNGKIVYW